MDPYVTAQPRVRIKKQSEETDRWDESVPDHIVRASVIGGISFTVTRTVCAAALLQPLCETLQRHMFAHTGASQAPSELRRTEVEIAV